MPKYLPTRTRSARPKFDHYPMLTRSTRFLLEPMSRSSRSPFDRTRSLPDPYPIPFDLYPFVHDHFSSIPDRYPTLHTRNELQYVPPKRREDINPSVIIRSVLEDRLQYRRRCCCVSIYGFARTQPQKAEKGKQRSAPTPVEVDNSRDDSPARPSLYLLRCTNHNTDVCRSMFQCCDRVEIEKRSSNGLVCLELFV